MLKPEQTLIKALQENKAVVINTDTVLGILALDEKLIVEAKKRYDPNKKIVKLINNYSQIEKEIPEDLKKLLDNFWPGALTIVYKGIGYRMPNTPIILSVIDSLNKPIFASSANISNQPTSKSISEAKKAFEESSVDIEFIETEEENKERKASTVYDYDNKKMLREGEIKEEEIVKFLKD